MTKINVAWGDMVLNRNIVNLFVPTYFVRSQNHKADFHSYYRMLSRDK